MRLKLLAILFSVGLIGTSTAMLGINLSSSKYRTMTLPEMKISANAVRYELLKPPLLSSMKLMFFEGPGTYCTAALKYATTTCSSGVSSFSCIEGVSYSFSCNPPPKGGGGDPLPQS